MISKRLLISTITVISLAQLFLSATAESKPAEAANKIGVKPKCPVQSKRAANKSEATVEPGMNPNEHIPEELKKPTGLRHKILKPIKSVFSPIRFLWEKFRILKNKIQNRNKKAAETPAESEPNQDII